MRTAVVRVGVDRAGELAPVQLSDGMARLRELTAAAGIELVENDLAALPPQRREVELLIAGDEPDELQRSRSACAPRRSVQPQSPGW